MTGKHETVLVHGSHWARHAPAILAHESMPTSTVGSKSRAGRPASGRELLDITHCSARFSDASNDSRGIRRDQECDAKEGEHVEPLHGTQSRPAARGPTTRPLRPLRVPVARGPVEDRDHPQCKSERRRAPSRRHLPPQHRQRRRCPDGHRVQLRVLAAAKRQADRERLRGQGRGVPLGRGRGDEDHRRRRGLLRPQAQHRQVRRLHVLRRRSQRRVLLRLRRNQEPVRYLGRQEFHRALTWAASLRGPAWIRIRKPTCSRR